MEMANSVNLKYSRLSEKTMLESVQAFRRDMTNRRSVRDFSSEPIPIEILREAVRAAGCAPSGANKQPWSFVIVTDPEVKKEIRAAAEAEETTFYEKRASDEWLEDLKPFGTTPNKPMLEEAPALIVVLAQLQAEDGGKNYYVRESVGIAVGMLLSALQLSGVCALTHTPNPMGFLADILQRPSNERPFLLIPVGYPKDGCQVPDIERKDLDEILTEI